MKLRSFGLFKGELQSGALDGFLRSYSEWLYLNWVQIVLTGIILGVVYFTYKFLTKRITRLREQNKLEENLAFSLNKIFKCAASSIFLIVIFAQFGVEIGVIAGFLALAGGTIIGFAAINTIGNAIAGIIIMTSRPFRIDDRIFFNGQFADVKSIDLIYTRMKTLDNVLISIPNQELLKTEIDNYEKHRTIRRKCSITSGYEVDSEQVEKSLLKAASEVELLLREPKPYVRITKFGNYAVEYTLYVFINQIKQIQEIDANLKKTVLKTCRDHRIDISTPSLIRSVNDDNIEISTPSLIT